MPATGLLCSFVAVAGSFHRTTGILIVRRGCKSARQKQSTALPLFELARVLVRFDHVARFIETR
jgi:hypothetical protein